VRRESNLRELEDSFTGPAASGKDIATIAKALAHPARIHIVRLLMEKQSCIGCDIVDEVGLAQSTVSEHLRILKAAGVITGEIERPRVCYSLNPESLLPLAGLLNAIFENDSPTISAARSAARHPAAEPNAQEHQS
jgi:ArsR family transcriptional regulator, arsenate/arsenite/antimonite-responsive transcriptional repressor